jgi:hypothetical protein
MYIYIDESGLFSTSDNENSWSSVGAIVIPDESLEKVENALNRLKQVNKLNNSEELKRNRPDSSSESFIYFIKSLKKYKCTLHVISTNGTFNDEESIINHKKSTMFYKYYIVYCSLTLSHIILNILLVHLTH